MTDIYRLFDTGSRALKCIKGKQYAGQSFDSCSATLHVSYSDSTFLEADSEGRSYTPYIIFDVYSEDGAPYAYGPTSTPAFDGYTFDIPWDITSAETGRIQYQLCFTYTGWEVDDRGVAIVVRDAENLLSAKDGIVLKPSIKGRCAPAGRMPLAPYQDPSVTAIVSMLLDRALVMPVGAELDDETNRIVLVFNTYNGKEDVRLTLDVPYLTDDGTVSAEFIAFADAWDEATADTVASSLMVRDALALKVDSSLIVTEWSEETSDGRIPSEALVKGSLDKKVDLESVTTEWSDPLSDGSIPSEKLVKDTIDTVESELQESVGSLVALADTKTDIVMAVPAWDAETVYGEGSTVVVGTSIYVSLESDNVGHDPETSEGWWSEISGASDDRTFSVVIGDGSSTSYTVAHGLGTRNLHVALRLIEADSEESRYVDAKVTSVSDDEVRVDFTTAPDEKSVVVILSAAGPTGTAWCGTIGNGVDSVYEITHNLGTYNLFRSFRMTKSGEYVHAAMYATSLTMVRLEFENVVDTDAVTVMLAPCVPTDYEGRFVYEQREESDTWTINHGLGRAVIVQAYDADGTELLGEVVQDMKGLNTVIIRFSEPVSGYAVMV